jgi:hypothetical protein
MKHTKPHIDSQARASALSRADEKGELVKLCYVCKYSTNRDLEMYCKQLHIVIDEVRFSCDDFRDARAEKNFEPLRNTTRGSGTLLFNKIKRK